MKLVSPNDTTTFEQTAEYAAGTEYENEFVMIGVPSRHECTSPEAAAAAVLENSNLTSLDREVCLILCLDTRHRLLKIKLVAMGTTANTFMAPREVFRDAITAGSAAIIVVHNHPSGDPTASEDDLTVSRRLQKAGDLLGVEMLDHLIFGHDDSWVSLARQGHLSLPS
jgi:DNA repair protein RadC